MKTNKDELRRVFSLISRVANGRLKEVLGNVRLTAADGVAVLIATDCEMFAKASLPVTGDLDVLLPVTRTSALLSEGRTEEVELERVDNKVRFRFGRSKFDLAAGDPMEFPGNIGEVEPIAVLLAKDLRTALQNTEFACDVASTRFQLGGVAMEFGKDVVECVATDGRRLANVEVKAECQKEAMYIVPAKAVKVLVTFLAQAIDETEVTISVSSHHIRFDFDGFTFQTTLVEGRYPNWRQVIPNLTGTQEILLEVGEVRTAIRQAAVVCDKESSGVLLNFSKGVLGVQTKNAMAGETELEVPIAFDGEQVNVQLDAYFLLDFLKVAKDDQPVRMTVKDSTTAVMLNSNDSYRYILMPMSRN